jgi:hypothetical protein
MFIDFRAELKNIKGDPLVGSTLKIARNEDWKSEIPLLKHLTVWNMYHWQYISIFIYIFMWTIIFSKSLSRFQL